MVTTCSAFARSVALCVQPREGHLVRRLLVVSAGGSFDGRARARDASRGWPWSPASVPRRPRARPPPQRLILRHTPARSRVTARSWRRLYSRDRSSLRPWLPVMRCSRRCCWQRSAALLCPCAPGATRALASSCLRREKVAAVREQAAGRRLRRRQNSCRTPASHGARATPTRPGAIHCARRWPASPGNSHPRDIVAPRDAHDASMSSQNPDGATVSSTHCLSDADEFNGRVEP